MINLSANAQMQVDLPEENGLLWEITGKGLTKPSYVYGTMHVSSKLAFHLGDSFYFALQNVDMVALEQNLDTVIDDWVTERDRSKNMYGSKYFPTTSLRTFSMNKIDKDDINRAISYDPYVLNSIMFRTNEDDEDFQQETYLDLYIYRLGKKMGKVIGGVEDYKEADKLVKKAQKGAREDYKNKRKNGDDDSYYKFRDFDFNDAYRKGNIKLIDSFERNTNGPKFMEYMLFVRNENMVRRMDSIMQLGTSLFTGVGCAHFGAERGVLNLLVKEGYTIRPVQSMANRISNISKKYDDMQYPLTYAFKEGPDSTFSAKVPGEWIQAFNNSAFKVFIYPELVNGYFYTVYKLNTNGTFFGEKPDEILLKVDSSLFESVPGKIIEQKDITVDGYKGYEIINKTTEGDFQRYYIIVKPLEVCIFKLGGKKAYAKSADADQFFKSIRFTTQSENNFKKYKTADGTVSFNFPSHAAQDGVINYENKQVGDFNLTAYDEKTSTTYLAQQLRANRNLDEDTFDLKVLLESFVNIDDFTLDNYRLDVFHGYDRIVGSMHGDKDRKAKAEIVVFNDRIIMLSAISEGENEPITDFFNSLELNDPVYKTFERYHDTVAKYTVSVPSVPLEDLESDEEEEEDNGYYSYYSDDEDEGDSTIGLEVAKTFAGKNGEEVIQLRFFTKSKYEKYDSLRTLEISYLREKEQYSSIVDTFFRNEGKQMIVDATIGDTATPMVNFTRNIYSQGGFYEIYGAYNKVKGKSKFLTTFLESFKIVDTVWSANPFTSSFNVFYNDYFSKDSANRERLVKKLTGWGGEVAIEDEDAPKLISFIRNFYIEEDYVVRKAKLIEELGWLDHKAVYPALEQFYVDFGDTTNLKMAVLTSLSRMKTKKSYAFIKEKLMNDLPIGAQDLDNIFYRLDDSLKLVVNMFPSFLDLTIVDEIEDQPYRILGRLLDSNLIKPKAYKKYLNTIYLDGFYSLKRALVKEETKTPDQLGMVSRKNKDKWSSTSRRRYRSRYSSYSSNSDYLMIARLLLPFKDKNTKYKQFFQDMHRLKDVDDRYEILKFNIKHNLDYPDTMVSYYAKRKKYRLKLFNYLQEEGRLDLFPKAYKKSDSVIYAKIQGEYNTYYSKIDSLKLLRTFIYNQKGKSYEGRVYRMLRKGAEKPDIISVTGIMGDSLLASHDYTIRLRSSLEPEQSEKEVVDKVVRQFILMATKPNYRFYDYSYGRYESAY